MTIDPSHLQLVPFSEIVKRPNSIPGCPGVYLIFVRRGIRLLKASAYFKAGGRRPLTSRGRHHLYTGAASDLRRRLIEHIQTNSQNSEFRATLLAMEEECRAISASRTRYCDVSCERSLSKWLRANAFAAFETCHRQSQYRHEKKLLGLYASPLNIQNRRGRPYARKLSIWRCAAASRRKKRQSIRRARLRRLAIRVESRTRSRSDEHT